MSASSPAALRPYRPYLGGAQGTALEKTSKTGQPDVRPLCAGEALRRLVGKVLLRSELPVLREHLLPYQLAVGVPAGVEVMPHLHRQWRTTFSADADRVCLSYDECNAHNVVDRHAFLTRMREVVPGVSRWLEYIYPTHLATKVFFHNVIIDSVAGGQQGCPLMMACHAVVQRMLLELGAVSPCRYIAPPVQLDIAPCFADDGLLAGPSGEVLQALQHWQGVLPQLGLRLSGAVVAPTAPFSHVDFQPFLSLGCHIAPEGNYEVLKSPSGSDEYCRAFCTERADRQIALLQRLPHLPDAQVGYYLMRWSCAAGRMQYLSRTTPSRWCGHALEVFDTAVHDTFCEMTGLAPDALAWGQATLPGFSGGLGLRSSVLVADAAYIGSRHATLERCATLWPLFRWDGGLPGTDLHAVFGALSCSHR